MNVTTNSPVESISVTLEGRVRIPIESPEVKGHVDVPPEALAVALRMLGWKVTKP